ncbi:hypothetical protein C0416_01170 [bacterium]|nr:hypothetical protein [bacterium]
MKKLALAGLISVLAVIALSGCTQADGEKVMKGKYLTTPYSGDIVIFTTDDSESIQIGFTNVEESFQMLGLKMNDKDCGSYSGEATLKVGKLLKNEPNPHAPFYAAELIEVVEATDPVCEM